MVVSGQVLAYPGGLAWPPAETIGDTELAGAVNSWLDERDSIDDNPA